MTTRLCFAHRSLLRRVNKNSIFFTNPIYGCAQLRAISTTNQKRNEQRQHRWWWRRQEEPLFEEVRAAQHASFWGYSLALSICGLGGSAFAYFYLPQFRKAVDDLLPESVTEWLKPLISKVDALISGAVSKPISSGSSDDVTMIHKPAENQPKQRDDDKNKTIFNSKEFPKESLKAVASSSSNSKSSTSPPVDVKSALSDAEERKRLDKERIAKQNNELAMTLKKLLRNAEETKKKANSDLVNLETKTRQYIANLKASLENKNKSKKESLLQKRAASDSKRKDAQEKAMQTLQKYQIEFDKLREELSRALAASSSILETKTMDLVGEVERSAAQLEYDLQGTREAVARAESEMTQMTQYSDLNTKAASNQLDKQMAEILPANKIASFSPSTTTTTSSSSVIADDATGGGTASGDATSVALLAQSHEKIAELRQTLEEHEAATRSRIQSALAHQRAEDERLAGMRLEAELQRERSDARQSALEAEKRARAAHASQLEAALERQAAAYNEHLGHMLSVQRVELTHTHETELRAARLAEREAFNAQVAHWTRQIEAVEAAVEGRAHTERFVRDVQSLWRAGQRLDEAVVSGAAATNQKRHPIGKSGPLDVIVESANHALPAVSDAASGDASSSANQVGMRALVRLATQSGVDGEAREHGVYTEMAIRKRFLRVRRVCARVALLDASGGSLALHFYSWLRSLLLIGELREETAIEEGETAKEGESVEQLLASAERALTKDDIEEAVRHMNRLPGLAGAVAADWVKDARRMLEVRQCARLLMALAAAESGVLS